MASFERIGAAILHRVADWSFAVPYAWGRVSAEQLSRMFANLVVAGSPSGTLIQLHGLRGAFFSFDPVVVTACNEKEATIEIDYEMCDIPEAAACYQAMGFYEGIVGLAGGKQAKASFSKRRWEGHDKSVLNVTWEGERARSDSESTIEEGALVLVGTDDGNGRESRRYRITRQ